MMYLYRVRQIQSIKNLSAWEDPELPYMPIVPRLIIDI